MITGYSIIKEIFSNLDTHILRAVSDSTGNKVIIKIKRNGAFESSKENSLHNEAKAYEFVSGENWSSLIEFREATDYCALVIEDICGDSLENFIRKDVLDFSQKLKIAIEISKSLEILHDHDLIHKDINPTNIICTNTADRVCVIDLGLAETFDRVSVQETFGSGDSTFNGTIKYMSPEQTGRIGRKIDTRSDLYSLGVTLYELFSGVLPFKTRSDLETMHAHIAIQPKSPSRFDKRIPEILSEIVLKLLNKSPGQRYQSAYGLRKDLERCIAEWKEKGRCSQFAVGKHDVSEFWQFPEKIYGRDKEIRALTVAYENTSERPRLLLLYGYSGVGKTTICKALLEYVKTEGGVIADGKYQQVRGEEPFSAIKKIIRSLIANALRFETEELNRFRARLSLIVGQSSNVLIEFIPDFKNLLDSSEDTLELGVDETANRFNSLLAGFIKLFTKIDNKLALFLDDIQWIDPASLRFLRLLFSDVDLRNIIVVGAYRHNEVDEQHLLNQGILSFKESGIEVEKIEIGDLNQNSISQLVEDTFHLPYEERGFLQEMVINKTKGNPFFTRELIVSFCRSNLIYFNRKENKWQVDSKGISNTAVTINVADLVTKRIKDLPKDTISVISKASCIGAEYRMDVLAKISEQTLDKLNEAISAATKDGVIFKISHSDTVSRQDNASNEEVESRMRFSHDQVQEAFSKLLDENERKEIHLKIGRLYLEQSNLRDSTNHVFDICDQLNHGLELISDVEEIGLIAELNLHAAIDAKTGGARAAAGNYIETALELIKKTNKRSRAQVEYKILLEAAQIYHSKGEFEKSEEFSEQALKSSNTLFETAVVQNIAVIRLTMQGAYQDAVDLGGEVLGSLGVNFPEHNVADALEAELAVAPSLEKIHSPEFTNSLLLMENENIEIAMKIMANLLPPTHFLDLDLNGWVAAKMVNLTINYGFAPESAKGLVNYGSLLALRGDYHSGYLFGKLAVDLIERFKLPQLIPRVHYAFLGDLAHWAEPLANSREMADEAFITCVEYGETAYAGYLLTFGRCMNEIFLGEDLEQFSNKVYESINYSRSTKNLHAESVGLATAMGISHLLGETSELDSFDIETVTEVELIRSCESREDFAAIALFRLLQAQNFYFIGQYEESRSAIKAVRKMEQYFSTGMPISMSRFYDALITLAELKDNQNKMGRERGLRNVNLHLDQLDKWTAACPENFAHLKNIVEGEVAYVENNLLEAISYFSKSIFYAEKEKYYQFVGLANEKLALIWKELDNDAYFKHHITKAYDAYFEWNAKIKLRKMREEYKFLAKPTIRNGQKKNLEKSTRTRRSSSSKQEELDFAAISAVTHSISQEINFDELMRKLATSITEVSGADKYALLLNTGKTNQLELKSVLSKNSDGQHLFQSENESGDFYPRGIVNYVSRSQEILRVSKSEIRLYSEDEYFQRNTPGSILCIPIVLQGRVLGVIYLENRELENIFTDERMETISIICTQAGVSIHNALLFTSLEKQVGEKTKAYLDLNSDLEKRVTEQVSEIEKLNTFQRFVSPPVAKMLMTGEGRDKLKSHRKEISILFCDLRGFTAYSETVEPEEAMNMLNMYHAIVGRLVNKYEATIDHRAGDGLMIFLNDPFDVPYPIRLVVEMAIELRQDVNTFLEKLKNQGDKIGFGIGIAFGYSTIGMIGHEGRYDYAASGRYVNLSSRLCDEAKDGQILMPQKIAVSGQLEKKPTPIGDIVVKGFSQKIGIYLL